jgi:DNA repair exonuclease SbcCD ATPase subunit
MKTLEEGAKCPQCKQIVSDEHKNAIIKDLTSKSNEMQSEMETQIQELGTLEKQLEDLKKEKGEFETDFKAFQQINPLSDLLEKIKDELVSYKAEQGNLQKELAEIIVDKTPSEYNEEIAKVDSKITKFSEAITRVETIDNAQTAIKKLNEEIKGLNNEKTNLEKDYKPEDLNEAKINVEKLEDDLERERILIPTLSNVLERVIEKVSVVKELNGIKTKLATKLKSFDISRYNELKTKKEEMNQRIGEVKSDIKTLSTDIIPSLKKLIKDLKEKIEELNEKRLELVKEKKKSVLIKTIREFCRDITPVLRQQKTSQISAKASEIFLDLVGTAEEFEGISITENYDLYVSRYGVDEDITILSGGEQVISCLAIRLAISEILANQGLILLDEPTSHLDEGHVKDLVEVFEIYSPARQLITVTHDDEFEKIADSLIQVYKQRGISQIM